MPIYEYVCMSCESHFEELVGMSDPDPACPDCGKAKVAKQFSTSFAAHGTRAAPFGGGLLRRFLWQLRLTFPVAYGDASPAARACALAETRTQVVFGSGSPTPT